ncbi:MAG: C25 family peptidase propeptide domain-containing protein, partial [Candidatus Hydrothermia bacterium]
MIDMLLLGILAQAIAPARTDGSLSAKQPPVSGPALTSERDTSAGLTIISSDENHLIFTLDFPSPQFSTENINGKPFLRFSNTGWGKPGEPDLPGRLVSFAIPRGKSARVSVSVLEESSFLGPAPLPCPRYIDDGLTPVYEAGRYETPWPKSIWDERSSGLLRHLKYMSIIIYPCSYNGTSYTFRKKIKVKVDFVPQDDGLVQFSGYDPFDEIYALELVNWKGQSSWKAALPTKKAIPDPFSSASVWIKAYVREPGIYEISYEDMTRLGVAPALLSDPNGLSVFSMGNDTMRSDTGHKETIFSQVASRVDDGGDGVFGPGDRILFYAEGIPDRKYSSLDRYFDYWNHPYTDTVVYWVAVGFNGIPERAAAKDARPSAGIPCSTSVAYAHHEKNEINLGQKGIIWVQKEPTLSLPQSSMYADYPFEMICKGVGTGRGTINIATVGIAISGTGDATYQVWLNGQMVGQSSTTPGMRRFYKVQVTNLREGTNTVTIRLIRTDEFAKEIYLDYIDIEYDRRNEYPGETSFFFPDSADNRYTVFAWGPKPVFLWDVSDPFNPVVLRNFTWDNGQLQFTDSLWGGKRIYLSTFTRKPVKLVILDLSVNLRDPSNRADYIICGPDVLMEPCRALADWRAENLWLWNPSDSAWENTGGKVFYVRLEDVYDQFG